MPDGFQLPVTPSVSAASLAPQWDVPELPDIIVYQEALDARVTGQVLKRSLVLSPFVIRSVDPPLDALSGRTVRGVSRLGKRLVLAFDDDLFVVLHLMIAGRLRWRAPGQKPGVGARMVLARFEFAQGTLLFTEAGSRKRASLHVVRGAPALAAMDRGGLEPLTASLEQFSRCAGAREPHPQTVAHGPAAVQRDRQRVLRRNPSCGATLAHEADAVALPEEIARLFDRDTGIR